MTYPRSEGRSGRWGVLVMSYGSPTSVDGIEAYYTHIRRGRPPTEEQVADLRRRYDAIGGLSPLAARTRAQADGIATALGEDFVVEVGAKHAAPFIEDAMAGLVARGVERVVGLVLAPHDSSMSIGEYQARAAKAAGETTELRMVRSWHLEPELIALLAERVTAAHDSLEESVASTTVFTAHSLPERILTVADPYPEQLRATAAAVAERADLSSWSTAYQSAGRTPEPWLGPDILDVVRVAPARELGAMVVCPAGFTSDHLEVLYDIDIEARRVAEEAGVTLVRTASLNDDPRLCALLADVVRRAAA
ncbi:MAG TPA: ferrochelatase [Acidimicrobiales bacterium]|nr:ferrochelatase [Acidimicrobiales bacterium]